MGIVSVVWLLFFWQPGFGALVCNSGFYSYKDQYCTPCLSYCPANYIRSGTLPCVNGLNNPCTKCPSGTYASFNATSCSTCPTYPFTGLSNVPSVCNITKYYDITCTPGNIINSAVSPPACKPCLWGTYNFESTNYKTVCDECPKNHYSLARGPACFSCQNAYTDYMYRMDSYVRDNCICIAGYGTMNDSSTKCTACEPGFYNTRLVANAESKDTNRCAMCAPGTYSTAIGSTMMSCLPCAAGSYSTGASASTCISCPAGKYSTAVGEYLFGEFEYNYGRQLGSTNTYAQIFGTFKRIGDYMGRPAFRSEKYEWKSRSGSDDIYDIFNIEVSPVGVKYVDYFLQATEFVKGSWMNFYLSGVILNPVGCMACPIPIDVEPGRYYFRLAASSENCIAKCPSLPNGTYTGSSTLKTNRCMDFTCNQGFYALPSDIALANTSCQVTASGLNTSCAQSLEKICRMFSKCPDGISTVLRTLDGTPILDSSTSDIQCTKCVSCMPGTVQVSPCNGSHQTVCAICSTTSQYAGYPWNDRCMLYDKVPGTMTISTTPPGYLPYMLTYPPAAFSAIANNSISYPTKTVDSFTLDSDTYTMTTSSLVFSSTVYQNIFIPCPALSIGRRFKAWEGFKAKSSTTVTCTSITNCANFEAPCDMDLVSECLGWNETLGQGWYASTTGECTFSLSNSTYSTCGWGEYRILSNGATLGCTPCRGTLPTNAVWTTSRIPHYFSDSEPTPCDWDCDKGFFRDGNECKACVKPRNSVFDYGPYIAYGNTDPPAMTCLNPDTCKYIGGVKGFGCAWQCPSEFEMIMLQTGEIICEPCPTLSCAADEFVLIQDVCGICQKCANLVKNAVYQPGCTFTCAPGYFLFNATYCKRCSACPAGQYSEGCGNTFDSTCFPCASCAYGFKMSRPCSATENTICSACTASLVENSTYDSSCNVVCVTGYVMSLGNKCVPCASSDANCNMGQRKASTCTALNLGCEACVAPTTNNWCWTNGVGCSWDCGPGYQKQSGICVADASKTINPCISEVFATLLVSLLTTTSPETLPPLTTSQTVSTLVTSMTLPSLNSSETVSTLVTSMTLQPLNTSQTVSTLDTSTTLQPLNTSETVSTLDTSMTVQPLNLSETSTLDTSMTLQPLNTSETVSTLDTSMTLQPLNTSETVSTLDTSMTLQPLNSSETSTLDTSMTLQPLNTSLMVTALTTQMENSSSSNISLSTSLSSTSPLMRVPNSTVRVTRETLTVANLTISQCLCSSSRVAAELSILYQTKVYVVSCATDTSNVECTNFVCPCSLRRLLQVGTVRYTLAFKRVLEQLKPAAVTRVIQAVIPAAVVTATQSELLDTTKLDWASVISTGISGGVVVACLFVLMCVGIGIFFATRKVKSSRSMAGRLIPQTIEPNDSYESKNN